MNIKVKQQKELGSKQWGVYVNGELIEGGFFRKSAAEDWAWEYVNCCPEREPQCDSQYSDADYGEPL